MDEEERNTVANTTVLQCMGVEARVPANVAAPLVRSKLRFHHLRGQLGDSQRRVPVLTDQAPTFMEMHDPGVILDSVHDCTRG